jgi:anthranilate phosphoribosyltransferase
MFAPAHHSAMRFAGPIRQEIGIRTMMNVLGPMTNPAGAKRQVIGVFSQDWQHKMAEVLKLLGSEHALIVHSQGLDEIRLDAPTSVVELKDGVISQYEITPQQFGFSPRSETQLSELVATSTESSLALIKQSMTDDTSAAADIVSLNAGASIYASGVATSLANGIAMAQDAISTGLAKERFNELVRVTKMMQEA